MNHGSSALNKVAVWVGLVVGLAGWTSPTTDAIAAPNCRKGIPCGNSCIAANRTCHRDSAPIPPARTTPQVAPTPAATPAPAVAPSAASAPPPVVPVPAPLPRQSPTGGITLWIASEADRIYFAPDCPAAADIAPANRRYFPDEETAEAAGFRRSSAPGC